jgi:uncharacterized protein
MSVTVDANVLLYASDTSSPFHDRNRALLERLVVSPELLYLFWPTVVAYLRIATHPAIFDQPLDPAQARENIDDLVTRANVRSPGEQTGFWSVFSRGLAEDVVRGNLVSDAHLVALMRQHDVGAIWTSDRDFRRFDGVRVLDLNELDGA